MGGCSSKSTAQPAQQQQSQPAQKQQQQQPQAQAQQGGGEPIKAMPFAIMRNGHEAIRGGLRDCEAALAAGDRDQFNKEFTDLIRGIHVHMMGENNGFFPLVNKIFGDTCTKEGLEGEHTKDSELEHGIRQAVDSGASVDDIKKLFDAWAVHHRAHLEHEEKVLMPLTQKTSPEATERAFLAHNFLLAPMVDTGDFDFFLGWAMQKLEKYAENMPRARVFAHALQACSTPEEWQRFLPIVRSSLSPQLFAKLVEEAQIEQAGKMTFSFDLGPIYARHGVSA